MKKISKKFLSCLMLIIVLINAFGSLISNATEISSAALVKIGDCDYHLKYYRDDTNSYRYVICTVVGHYNNNVFYPAYCLNKDLTGVTEEYSYTVNIKDVINRDDVWRVVKNGYPYKTYQEMGLSNEFNAFAVTKFAVYCILGQSDINKFYAEPNDPEANAMLNCLRNLVSIGKNGTETRKSGNFSIEKIGSLKQEGNYYTQEYKVNSNIEMNNFEVAATTNFPLGSYVKKTSNSNIKLFIPTGQVKENISGIIHLRGKCKTYPIFYGESGNANYQDYAITYSAFGDVSSACKTEFIINNAKLKLIKVDSESKQKISNTKFSLYKDGELLQTKTTDNSGTIVFTGLVPGKYSVKEIESNKDYVLNVNSKDNIIVTYNNQTEITIINNHKKGNLKIVKVDKDDNRIPLKDVEFELYDKNSKLVGKYITDSKGEIKINNLNTGKYKLKEIKTKTGYKLLDEIQLEIKWNETLELRLTNEKNKGKIKVIKVDKDNNEIKIPGVKFGVYNKNNELLETLVTDKNGEAVSKDYPVYDNEYYIKELETNQNYVLNEEKAKIKLKENEITNIKFENEYKKGSLEILKVDKETKTGLKGIEFKLYDSKNNLIKNLVTDENGKIYVDKLKIGTDYYLIETKTKEGYVLNGEKIKFDINYNQSTKLEISNEKTKGMIKVIKVDKDNNEVKIPGVKFGIYNDKDELLETLVTDENGEAISKGYSIYNNEYFIKELETNQNYVLNEEKVKIELKENEITNIKFENEFKKGNLEIIKVDKDTKEILKGIEFELYDSQKNKLGNYITDEKGKIYVENLKIGNDYYLIETKTKEGYNLVDEKFKFDINYNQTTKLEISNEKIKGNLKIIKVDKDNNEIRIPGVKFGIYNEKDELLEEIVTNEKGEAVSSYYPVNNEKYYIRELETNERYELNSEKVMVELKENEIVTIKFENELKKGCLELLKIDYDTKEPIQGVEFELYDIQKNKLGNYKTDENGKIFIKDLKPKKDYYLKEIKTLKEYKLSKDLIFFDINCNETTVLEVTNEKIKGKLKVIKVDKDDKNKKLEGVKFDIYDEKSNLLESLVTDKDGVAYSSLLPVVNRIYAIVETETLPGYIKNEEYIFFKLNNLEVFELLIENEKEKVIEKKEDVSEKENDIVEEKEEIKILPRTGM